MHRWDKIRVRETFRYLVHLSRAYGFIQKRLTNVYDAQAKLKKPSIEVQANWFMQYVLSEDYVEKKLAKWKKRRKEKIRTLPCIHVLVKNHE